MVFPRPTSSASRALPFISNSARWAASTWCSRSLTWSSSTSESDQSSVSGWAREQPVRDDGSSVSGEVGSVDLGSLGGTGGRDGVGQVVRVLVGDLDVDEVLLVHGLGNDTASDTYCAPIERRY